jgi:tetratricopeptide (TPR) repeat protein
LILNSVLGWTYLAARDIDKALAQCLKTLEMEPDFADAQDCPVQLMMLADYPEEELFPELLKRDFQFGNLSNRETKEIKQIFNKDGLSGYWRTKLNILIKKSETEYVWTPSLTECYEQSGEIDKALKSLEDLFEKRDPLMTYTRIWVFLDPLRSESRIKNNHFRLN